MTSPFDPSSFPSTPLAQASDAFGTYPGYPEPNILDCGIAYPGANNGAHASQGIPYAETGEIPCAQTPFQQHTPMGETDFSVPTLMHLAPTEVIPIRIR
ncbi:hypothetical protein PCANC_05886 [Puccinia coronata f. sp. avenae]|uniref:Uncharacterized protein n=1 Tax=Puccinia coronata f. sp. avenae TaxID=200324 RepID=A0A2N5VBK0_9BASI|nr:hypothetical protein PCANC_25543 [Puccinia coronata f. sp. avenae]PLW47389.1 hypothetical protein PCANC_05886 [Puccinia coronata f. sp. avenae]